jgi:hypothetical protein
MGISDKDEALINNKAYPSSKQEERFLFCQWKYPMKFG